MHNYVFDANLPKWRILVAFHLQADVSCIMKTLGLATQPLLGKATPIRLTESSAGGNPLPLKISSGESTHLTKLVSAVERGPHATSLVCGTDANNNELTTRHCTILKSATSSSSGGNPVDDYKSLTNEGLSRALSQYNMVNQKLQTPHESKSHKYPTTSSCATTIDAAAPVMPNNQRKRAPECVPSQEYWKSGSTGFKVYRPSGSFVWPSTMNLTHFNPQVYPASNTGDVQEVRVEDILSTGSPRISGITASSAISSSVQTNHSARSIGESHVAATMAGMFGCMAQQPGAKADTTVQGNNPNFLPRTVHLPQRSNHFVGHTGSTGSYYLAPPEQALRSELPRHLHSQRPCPLTQTKFSLTNPVQQQWQLNSSEASPTFSTLPLINTAPIEASGNNAMMTATSMVQCLSSTTTSGPALSLALSLSLSSPTPAIDSCKDPLKKASIWDTGFVVFLSLWTFPLDAQPSWPIQALHHYWLILTKTLRCWVVAYVPDTANTIFIRSYY